MKGVGPQKGDLLKKEAGIFTFNDLLEYFPFRHIDKTQITAIGNINPETEYVQVSEKLLLLKYLGKKMENALWRACMTVPVNWNWCGSRLLTGYRKHCISEENTVFLEKQDSL